MFHEYLIGKKFLFKVEVKIGFKSHLEPSFKVSKICYDPLIISKFLDSFVYSEKSSAEKPSAEKLIAEKLGHYYSTDDDFLKITTRKTIEELKDCREVSSLFPMLFIIL